MKISLDWLGQYIDLPEDTQLISEILTEIGLEVEGTEQHESVPGGLRGVVVGKVLECGQHPNADRLSLTKVDIGAEDLLQIVCGAPNVAAGQLVPVATVGTTLYDNEGKQFKIKKGKIRGEVSQGMICAEDELNLGTDHDGIMVLSEEAYVGQPAHEYFNVSTDTVFEIALTPNRSDATSHLGVARDLAAALKINYQHDGLVRLPDVSNFGASRNDRGIDVEVVDAEGCPRYAGVTISGLTVGPSPEWLQQRLSSIGVRPINNVVDVTNFVLHEMGQPLHAFDRSKIAGEKIIVRTLPKGSDFTTLDEVKRKLSEEDLMICDGDSSGMCIAGVFGGINSGVTADTTEIFLESAHFNAKRIRRTSGRHLLFTDAAKIFEKGSDPNVCVSALKRAARLICELCQGEISSPIVDIYPEPVESKPIVLRLAHLRRLSGAEITRQETIDILDALGAEMLDSDADQITVQFPTDKVDVTREVDVIEEVLRIYGFNRVPMPQAMRTSLARSSQVTKSRLRERLAGSLVANGFLETMNLSLVSNDLMAKMPAFAQEELVQINNTSNEQLEVLRPHLAISLVDSVRYNQNRQQRDLQFFEFGKTYQLEEGVYVEQEKLAILMTPQDPNSWLQDADEAHTPFYRMKTLVALLLGQLGVHRTKVSSFSNGLIEAGQELSLGKNVLAQYGALSNNFLQIIDAKGPLYYAEFDLEVLLRMQRIDQVKVSPISKFPSVRRDLALLVDDNVDFARIEESIRRSAGKELQNLDLFDVYRDKALAAEGKKSLAISLQFSRHDRTYSDKEVDQRIQKILTGLEKNLKVVLR